MSNRGLGTAQTNLLSGVKAIGGLVPHSLDNAAIAITPETDTVASPGNMTMGPNVKCFDALGIWVGCILRTQQAFVGAATGCAFTISGYKDIGDTPPVVLPLNYKAVRDRAVGTLWS